MSYLTYDTLQYLNVPDDASPLMSIIQVHAAWIWSAEDTKFYPPPQAPGNAQRVFRKTWSNSSPNTQSAHETTIIITADNSFELFVNGILVHARDDAHAWQKPLLFSVPVSGNRIIYAIRAVNENANSGGPTAAGLRAAVRISFTESPSKGLPNPETFHTGSDQTWLTSTTYGSGWEQPWYDDNRWTPAMRMPETVNGEAVWSGLEPPDRLRYAASIPQTATANASTTVTVITTAQPTSSSGSVPIAKQGITTLSNVQLAGMVVGIALGAALMGALASYMFFRRKGVRCNVQSFSSEKRLPTVQEHGRDDTSGFSSMYQ